MKGIRISGIASAIPKGKRTLKDDEKIFGIEETTKISSSTGVKTRYIVKDGECTSDLCFTAAKALLSQLEVPTSSIDALILVTQTPDYILPATSCVLHDRLGLSKSCITFDVNLGCSGYIYGLWLAANIISSGTLSRILFLAGDTISRLISPSDRSVSSLFGDAGTATIIEKTDDESSQMIFSLGTDGKGKDQLIVPAGGFRYPKMQKTSERSMRKDNNFRSDEDLYMNGPEIFSFSLREIPPLINTLLDETQWSVSDVDAFIFHQANGFMLRHLMRRLKIPAEKFILALSEYGNTSSASIPLAMTHDLSRRITGKETIKLLLSGFGVGYSWGGVTIKCGANLVLPKLTILD